MSWKICQLLVSLPLTFRLTENFLASGGGLPRSNSTLTLVAGREYRDRDRYDGGRHGPDRRDAAVSRGALGVVLA